MIFGLKCLLSVLSPLLGQGKTKKILKERKDQKDSHLLKKSLMENVIFGAVVYMLAVKAPAQKK